MYWMCMYKMICRSLSLSLSQTLLFSHSNMIVFISYLSIAIIVLISNGWMQQNSIQPFVLLFKIGHSAKVRCDYILPFIKCVQVLNVKMSSKFTVKPHSDTLFGWFRNKFLEPEISLTPFSDDIHVYESRRTIAHTQACTYIQTFKHIG